MADGPRLEAALAAAGASTRMGRPKLLLPLGPDTVLERTLAWVAVGRPRRVVASVDPSHRELIALLGRQGVEVALNRRLADGMAGSIRLASETLGSSDAWLLVTPADLPSVRPETITRLLNRACEAAPDALLAPTIGGRRGHPLLFGPAARDRLRSLGPDRTLRDLLAERPKPIRVPVDDPGIRRDLDRPEDYESLRREFR